MSNLIRLEDVLAIIDKRTVKGKLQVAREVLKLPTIEPRCETCEAFNKTRLLIPQPERKKGKWIIHGEPPMYVKECSACGEKFFHHQWQTLTPYCSMCGADMLKDGEADETH